MANPFGIEQVDVGGLLSMHDKLRHQRLADLYQQQQIGLLERKAALEDQRMGVMAKLFQGSGAAPSEASPSPASDVAPAPVSAAPAAVPSAEPAQPLSQEQGNAIIADAHQKKLISRQDAGRVRASLGTGSKGAAAFDKWIADNGITIEGGQAPVSVAPQAAPDLSNIEIPTDHSSGLKLNQDALRQLIAFDPQTAKQIIDTINAHDEMGLKAMTQRGGAMANVAARLQKMPLQDRAAEFQKWVPFLVDHGLPAEAIRKADLSDNGLARYFQQGRTIENVVQSDKDARDFSASQANISADNARADSAEARAARGEKRAEVRFQERDKDRAALAGLLGRISSDTSDLNY